MVRIGAVMVLLALGLAEAQAQSREIPIERDLQLERRLDRDIDGRPMPRDPFVTPDNPDGVVGFDGPPDPIDDGVDQGGPMPPGSPGNLDND